MATQRSALILGISGCIGGPAALALLRDGWRVRALARDPERLMRAWASDVEWIGGDVMDESTLIKAAEGTQLLMHAVRPPQYRNWRSGRYRCYPTLLMLPSRRERGLSFPAMSITTAPTPARSCRDGVVTLGKRTAGNFLGAPKCLAGTLTYSANAPTRLKSQP